MGRPDTDQILRDAEVNWYAQPGDGNRDVKKLVAWINELEAEAKRRDEEEQEEVVLRLIAYKNNLKEQELLHALKEKIKLRSEQTKKIPIRTDYERGCVSGHNLILDELLEMMK